MPSSLERSARSAIIGSVPMTGPTLSTVYSIVSVSVDVGLITPRKATDAAATLAAQILVVGECSVGNASPQIQSQSKVGEFYEGDSPSLPASIEEPNAPSIQRQIRDSGQRRNPGSGILIDVSTRYTPWSKLPRSYRIIRRSLSLLPAPKGSPLAPNTGREQGMSLCVRIFRLESYGA